MSEYTLTTTDNPYNPFDNFDKWYNQDLLLARQQGRPDCLGYWARMSRVNSQLPSGMYDKAVDTALDEIIEFNVTGKYMKVSEEEAQKTLI